MEVQDAEPPQDVRRFLRAVFGRLNLDQHGAGVDARHVAVHLLLSKPQVPECASSTTHPSPSAELPGPEASREGFAGAWVEEFSSALHVHSSDSLC